MEILNFIVEEGLIMVPVLYILAEFLKPFGKMKNKYVPWILLVVSIILTPLVLKIGYTADAIVQAILITGMTVLGHQLYKQARSDE